MRTTVNAQIFGEHLEKLGERANGRVTPQDIVKSARAKSSPIHGCFEWDNVVAADKHRIQQARHYANHLIVEVYISCSKPSGETRAYVSILDEQDDSAYMDIETVLGDTTLRKQLLTKALHEVQEWADRYKRLKELARVRAAIKSTMTKVKGKT